MSTFFLKNIHDENKLKLLTVHLFAEHSIENNKVFNKKLIQEMIIYPICRLLENELIQELPDFVKKFKNVSAFTPLINELSNEVMTKYQKMSEEEFNDLRISLSNEIDAVSNSLSQISLIKFLQQNENVKVVYGLVGANHLPMLEHVGETTIIYENKVDNKIDEFYWDGHYYIKLPIENRIVHVHLFGGKHDDFRAFESMKNYIQLHFNESSQFFSSAEHSTFYGKSISSNKLNVQSQANVHIKPEKKT